MNNKIYNTEELIDDMDKFQLARWMALYEGINLIADHMEEKNKKFDVMHIKQPPLESYVDEVSSIIMKSL